MAAAKPSKASKTDFKESQKILNSEIEAGNFKRAYLVCGDQAYLRIQNRDKIKNALMGDGDEMNLSHYRGSDFSMREVIELAETMPFLADRRVLVLENTGLFESKSNEDSDTLAEYLKDTPDTTSFLFVEESFDKRKKLYKAVDKIGTVLICDTPDESTIRAWAGSLFRKEGLSMSGRTLAFFLDYTGDDMQNIAGEAEKLCCYCLGRKEITEQDIRDVCSARIKDRIFDMISAIAMKDQKKALSIYMDLCALQTAPQIILTLMLRQFNQLLQVQELSGKMGDREIASAVGLPPFVITKRYRPALRNYSGNELLEALEACMRAEQDYKSGKMDARIAVEMVIVSCAT